MLGALNILDLQRFQNGRTVMYAHYIDFIFNRYQIYAMHDGSISWMFINDISLRDSILFLWNVAKDKINDHIFVQRLIIPVCLLPSNAFINECDIKAWFPLHDKNYRQGNNWSHVLSITTIAQWERTTITNLMNILPLSRAR